MAQQWSPFIMVFTWECGFKRSLLLGSFTPIQLTTIKIVQSLLQLIWATGGLLGRTKIFSSPRKMCQSQFLNWWKLAIILTVSKSSTMPWLTILRWWQNEFGIMSQICYQIWFWRTNNLRNWNYKNIKMTMFLGTTTKRVKNMECVTMKHQEKIWNIAVFRPWSTSETLKSRISYLKRRRNSTRPTMHLRKFKKALTKVNL